MSVYIESYLNVLKSNFMLVIMGFVLLIPTFFIWVGVPFFVVGGRVGHLISSQILVYLSISLSGGLIFSLYFFPINLKVAREVALIKKMSIFKVLFRLEAVWITIIAIVYLIVLNMII